MILTRVAAFVYALALRAFPLDHRVTYGTEMVDTFERELAARIRAHGSWRALRFVIAASFDAVSAGFGERSRYRQGRGFSRTSTGSQIVIAPWRDPRRGAVLRVGVSWLDVKLGVRMLVRYPGLSLAGGLGIALVVVCGTVAGMFDAVINGRLPFDPGDRVVAIENWDTSRNTPAAHDFFSWREELKTVQDVGAYRLMRRNVSAARLGASATSVRQAEPVRIAEISAAAFKIARVPPMLGRYLVPEDEVDGAAPVIVLGEDEWQRRFGGDPQLIGRILEVGNTMTTVVGVMPKGFGFPVNERYWMPLRLNPSDTGRGPAPSNMPYKYMPSGVVQVFGRLADGVDLAAAQAELSVIGQRAAIDSPETHARLRPRVLPYTRWFFLEQHDGEIFLVQGLVALLLGVVGANVAVLVYARTATRRIEIALRSALGASRRRIVTQMFVEGLVLSGTAAVVGLVIAGVARRELDALVIWEQAPFWVNTSVTSGTVIVYVLVVAVLCAAVVGLIPALQATGRRAQTGLQHAAASSSGWKIGRTYAVLIVVQVAVAVAILPYAVSSAWTSIREAAADPGFPANEFLTARLDIDEQLTLALNSALANPGVAASAKAARRAELTRRLEAEPGVSDVVFLAGVPGSEPATVIEIEGQGSHEVGLGQVDVDAFRILDVPILAGRQFDARDLDASSRHAIVNRTFAQEVSGGNPIGRLVREAGSPESAPGPWLEVVGVVDDFPATLKTSTVAEPRLYRPVARDDARLSLLALRVRGGPPTVLANRLREITTALDRRLLLRDIRPMDALLQDQQIGSRLAAWAAGLVTLSLLLLSATGLYALMAFTVTQRRREIGIRVALGADPHRLLGSIFARPLWQLAAGIVVGSAIAALVDTDLTGGAGLRVLPAVIAFVLLVGLAAAAGPARRGLRIQPTEAMRDQ